MILIVMYLYHSSNFFTFIAFWILSSSVRYTQISFTVYLLCVLYCIIFYFRSTGLGYHIVQSYFALACGLFIHPSSLVYHGR